MGRTVGFAEARELQNVLRQQRTLEVRRKVHQRELHVRLQREAYH